MSALLKIVCCLATGLLFLPLELSAAPPPDGIQTKTTYAKAYGETKNPVQVDPAKDLPRYPPVEPSAAADTWQVKNGFKLELVAHEPQVRDPIALCFDERGRMFVCEMIDYSERRDVTPHLGRISVLEDKDGDGFFESSQVFAEDLPWPTGLIWAHGGLYVGATPDLWRFEDRDGDGQAEFRDKVFTGFGTGLKILNVQGLMNSFQWGQDNRIHVLAGGGNRGLIRCLKRPELPAVELAGRDFWFDPLTHEFGLESGGAQYGMSFDNQGRKFGCSNSDHLQSWLYDERLVAANPCHRLPPSRHSIAVDGGAAEVFRISPDEPWRIIRTRWRIAGVVKGAVEGGGRVSGYFTGATGTTIYRGDAYGAEFVNNSFTGDAGGQLIHRKIIRDAPDGIDLQGERPADERGFEFAASKDTWVRVVNFANAPDGCLYVCDMYREVIEHPWSVPDEIKKHLDLNSGHDRGRIWRLVPDRGAPRKGQPITLAHADSPELVQTLAHPNGWHRDTAQRLLYERQDATVVAALKAHVSALDRPLAALHALELLRSLKALDASVVSAGLRHPAAEVRERAVGLAPAFHDAAEVRSALLRCRQDTSARVRFTYALLLPKFEVGAALAVAQQEMIVAAQGNAWLHEAVLSGVCDTALELLQALSTAKHPVVEGALGEELLRILGQRQDKADHRAVMQWLTSNDVSPRFRVPGLKAFAGGLRQGGRSLAKADDQGLMAAFIAQAAALAQDPSAMESARREAVELLALADLQQAESALRVCLAAEQSEGLQTAAVQAWSELAGKDVGPRLIQVWKGLKPKARTVALTKVLAREEGALAWLKTLAAGDGAASARVDGPQPADLSASQVQDLIHHSHPQVVDLAKRTLKALIPPSRAEAVAALAPAVGLKGNAEAGEKQFLARCLACHQANGQGVEVGPNLTTVKTKGREALLSAILEPHKEVASQYIAYTVTTKDGQTLLGIITRDEASSMTLKMMGGAVLEVPRTQIQGSRSHGQSLMPEGLEQGMSVQDMADLLSFIESVK